MCERMARNHPEIFFASMHPGWADTPAVRSSMPDFYEKMKVIIIHVLKYVSNYHSTAVSNKIIRFKGKASYSRARCRYTRLACNFYRRQGACVRIIFPGQSTCFYTFTFGLDAHFGH